MQYVWDESFLKKQADAELANINHVFNEYDINCNKHYSILDIGCSNGYNTSLIFKNFSTSNILGIDIDYNGINNAMKNNSYNNFTFECIDILEIDANEFIKKNGTFDIIYCAYVIQYITKPKLFLSQCHKLLNKNGKIIIKACDDNGKILYPKSEILREIIDVYNKYVAPDVDRFCAEKCFSWLYDTKFKNITYRYFIEDTNNLLLTEKIDLYSRNFAFRKFNLDTKDSNNVMLRRYNYLLDTLYELFQQDDFYYSSTSYIIVAEI